MKTRALILCDFDFGTKGGFKEAAEELAKIEAAVSNLVTGNKTVTHFQISMKERRGTDSPDIEKMKFRQN